MKKVAILGSTGSIGTQTLEIIRDNEDLQAVSQAAGAVPFTQSPTPQTSRKNARRLLLFNKKKKAKKTKPPAP